MFNTANFKIIHKKYFNAVGILGWYISGKLLKNKLIPKGQLKFYNFLVPLFKAFDKLVCNKIGLSVMTVGTKE